jgi:glycogen debranching enzyme
MPSKLLSNQKIGLIEQCYQKSIALLLRNSTSDGFLAATPKGKATRSIWQYDRIFGRDASICSLGAVASGDKRLIALAKSTLLTLARHQTELGQIPNALSEKKKTMEFWFMANVDGTLWWLIALDFYDRYGRDKKLRVRLNKNVHKAITWLRYQTGGTTNLLEQSEAGDWADIMPRSGHVLYSNALWYRVQKLYRLSGASLTASGINTLFYPFSRERRSLFYRQNKLYEGLYKDMLRKIKPVDYYLSHIKVFSAGRHCDVYANLLALLFGLPEPGLALKIISHIKRSRADKFFPIRVLTPPIKQSDREWSEVMAHENQNLPWLYQNGGIWPFVGGFWAMALHKTGEKKLALKALEKLARANKVNNWQFNEWFHGKTGKPMGMSGQSWNAGTFLLAYHYLKEEVTI